MNDQVTLTGCFGCGALVPEIIGPTHDYLGASPGCWAVFGEVLAKEFGEYRHPQVHRLTVDTYAVQHPGTPDRRAIQSVAIHLISLCLVLEHGATSESATKAMSHVLASKPAFSRLDPPPMRCWEMTIVDVREATDLVDHRQRVERWARSVWSAWSMHHDVVHQWLDMVAQDIIRLRNKTDRS